MKTYFISASLAAAALLLNASLCFGFADENAAVTPLQNSGKIKMSPGTGQGNVAAKHKARKNIKLVNINGATREELKKLPGIGNTEADKIIAGRPYASKADLVTHNIITRAVYEPVKKLIIAKQPYKDGAKNAAIYNNKKK